MRAACALVLVALVTGCGGVGARPVPPSETPVPATTRVSALEMVESPGQLSLSQLTDGLRDFVNAGSGPVGPRLAGLYEKWKIKPLNLGALMTEADLNGDGTPETVLTYRDVRSANGTGTLFVIYKKGDRYEVDRQQEECIAPVIHGVADLNGDGRPEVIWTATSVGANTTSTWVYATNWRPGQMERLPGEIITTNMTRLTVEGPEILLQGGSKGGWGAGRAQRERIDRYRWLDGSLRAVTKAFTPSTYAYHRLLDGLLAEEFGDAAGSGKAFAEAAEAGRPVLPDGDAVTDEWRPKLSEAVRVFAQFRLGLGAGAFTAGASGSDDGLLAAVAGARGREAICKAGIAWAEANPDFIKALNSPRGYANPQWKAADLCGPLPKF